MLASGATRQWLADRYGPEHVWSTSQLEQYGRCPYQFLLSRVLRLNELYDLSLEVDQLLRGRRTHALLATIHRRLASRPEPCSPCDLNAEEFKQLVEEALSEVMRSTGFEPSADSLDAALDVIDRRLVEQWIAGYPMQFSQYRESFVGFNSPPAPAHFEVSFGPVEGPEEESSDPLSNPAAYELTYGGLTIRLSGRVDRIDVGLIEGRVVFNVMDYKTGKSGYFRLSDIEECRKLQLPLYAMAVQDLLLADQNAIPWQAGYWHIPEKGYCAKQALVFHERTGEGIEPTESWQRLRDNVARHVAGLVSGIQSGQFPMYCEDEKCTGQCEYKTVCRVNDARSLEKTWQPPSANPK
jgi:ATP-dependent helicase/DNAse subunit B